MRRLLYHLPEDGARLHVRGYGFENVVYGQVAHEPRRVVDSVEVTAQIFGSCPAGSTRFSPVTSTYQGVSCGDGTWPEIDLWTQS